MNTETKTMHVTPVGGNIFADLGFAPEEAVALQAESKRRISAKLDIRAALMDEFEVWFKEAGLTQMEAAEKLSVTRPRISDAINKKVDKFTIDALVDILERAGSHVKFSVEHSLKRAS